MHSDYFLNEYEVKGGVGGVVVEQEFLTSQVKMRQMVVLLSSGGAYLQVVAYQDQTVKILKDTKHMLHHLSLNLLAMLIDPSCNHHLLAGSA